MANNEMIQKLLSMKEEWEDTLRSLGESDSEERKECKEAIARLDAQLNGLLAPPQPPHPPRVDQAQIDAAFKQGAQTMAFHLKTQIEAYAKYVEDRGTGDELDQTLVASYKRFAESIDKTLEEVLRQR
jgi:protein subunit release factor A